MRISELVHPLLQGLLQSLKRLSRIVTNRLTSEEREAVAVHRIRRHFAAIGRPLDGFTDDNILRGGSTFRRH